MASSEIIERTAIGTTGRVGSLYDGCRGYIFKKMEVNTKEIPSELPISCEIIYADTEQSRNVLEMIGIEKDLRLSILLNSSVRTGLAALVDHPDPFNKDTRFLHYKYVHRFEELDTSTVAPDVTEFSNSKGTPTHIITNVSWGIEVVVVLQLPSNVEMIATIDAILGKIPAVLRQDKTDAKFSLDDDALFEKYVKTKVYSNIPALRTMTSLFTVCQYINGCSDLFNFYRPLKYRLQPIKCVYPQYTGLELDSSYLCSPSINKLEQYLIQLLDKIRNIKFSFNCVNNKSMCTQLKERLEEVQKEWTTFNSRYEEEMERLHELIINIRRKDSNISEIDKTLEEHAQSTLKKDLEALTKSVTKLDTKSRFITTLHEKHFKYYNAVTFNIHEEDYVQILLDKLMQNPKTNRILCSNDILNEAAKSKLGGLCDQLTKEYEQNQDLNLIYADFTYCSFKLPAIIVLPNSEPNASTIKPERQPSSSEKEEIVNILLLGESGVGKSTFINAFVNYLAFETLQEAESKKPVVLIPVSFLITTGDNFDERTVLFGTSDDFKNENFDHPGESVTQHCKSYVFTLHHMGGKRLRIIDTPGFGDTRGLKQDDINMQHILKYVSNLKHLNAVCFLLKPNGTKLSNYFPICLTQLLDLLGENARQNIIFCFTNARSTFYAPGNIAPPLKAMLHSFSIGGIPFKKENTFCFDNESFRYLVALQNGIHFKDEEQKREYEMSWSTSLKESQRLVDYATNILKTYSLDSERQSLSNAQIEITRMVRPMLEAIRNNLRHIIMRNMSVLDRSIKLIPKAIHYPASRCHACQKQYFAQFGSFLITSDDPHEILKDCYQCACSPDQHYPINYVLQHELVDEPPKYDQKVFVDMNRQLFQASIEFAYFLIHTVRSTKDDPFSAGLTNIIIDECDLCQSEKPNMFNSKLVEHLTHFQSAYEKNMKSVNSNKLQIKLPAVYEWIWKMRTYSEVRDQLAAIQESQRLLMKEYEYVVPEDLMK